jgi:hypothetical protein
LFVDPGFAACQYEVHHAKSPHAASRNGYLTGFLDGKEQMKTRRFDDNIYIVYYDGDLFRAYHSDVADTPFVSVQDINSNDRKYAYVLWKLSDDGKRLTLRSVQSKVVPKGKKDSAEVAELLKGNARNPELFGEERIQKEK